jgi:DtxR family manganese transport transcriptional regulator
LGLVNQLGCLNNACRQLGSLRHGFSTRRAGFNVAARISEHMSTAKRKQNQHRRTRQDHATELAEDYVEAIAAIIDQRGQCRAVDLARQFEVSHVTVNRTVGRLQRDGLVTSEPYAPVELTDKGRRIARDSQRRHKTVHAFLLTLGVSERTATIDTEGLEHHVSPETLKKMQEYIDASQAIGK